MDVVLEGYLPAGSYSTHDTLAIMAQYAVGDSVNPKIQNLADKITKGIHPADQLSQMLAVRNWILANLLYVTDASEAKRLFRIPDSEMEHGELEAVKSPEATLKTKRYDCDCGASLIASVLLALGIPVRFMAVSFHPEQVTGPDGFSHVFAQGFDGSTGQWVILDPVSYPNEKQMLREIKQTTVFSVG